MNLLTGKTKIIGIAIFFCLSSFSYAENISPILNQIVNTFDPGQTEKNLPVNRISTLPTVAPNIKKEVPSTEPIPQAEKIHFKLTKVIFSGNKIFIDVELNAIFSSSLHKEISLAKLQSLVDEISAKYRNAGYVLTQAYLPPQKIKQGVVHINIVEGYISRATIQGNPGLSRTILEKYGNKVLQSKPLNISVLEYEILLANDLPGETVRAVITPSKNIPDSSDLTLFATHQWTNGYVIYNNYGTRFLGPLQTSVGGQINSLLFPGDSNALHFSATSKTEQLQFAEFVHTQVIGSNGLNSTVGVNYIQTKPGFLLTDFDIIGRSSSLYGNLTYPLIRTRTHNLFLKGLGNYQNVNATILSSPFYQDRFRTLGLGLEFDGLDSWHGSNTLELTTTHGFGIMGAQKHFYQSRPDGTPIFTQINFNGSRLQSITDRLFVYLGSQGQYSFNPLLATQQFSYGGPYFGRGYDSAEFVGDRGLAGKIEVRFQTIPGWRFLQAIQYYVFYDAGVIWNIDNINLPGKQSATSTGVGARFNFMSHLDGEMFIAKPLTTPNATLVALGENGKGARGYFQIILHE